MKDKIFAVVFSIIMIIMTGTMIVVEIDKLSRKEKLGNKLVNKTREQFGTTSFIAPTNWKRDPSETKDEMVFFIMAGGVPMPISVASTENGKFTLIPIANNQSSKIRIISVGKINEDLGSWFETFLNNKLKDKQFEFASQALSKGTLEKNGFSVVSKELLVGEQDGKTSYNYYFVINPSSSQREAYAVILSSTNQEEYLSYRHTFLQFVYSIDFQK